MQRASAKVTTSLPKYMLRALYRRSHVALEAGEAHDKLLNAVTDWYLSLIVKDERIFGVIKGGVSQWRERSEILTFLAWLVDIVMIDIQVPITCGQRAATVSESKGEAPETMNCPWCVQSFERRL